MVLHSANGVTDPQDYCFNVTNGSCDIIVATAEKSAPAVYLSLIFTNFCVAVWLAMTILGYLKKGDLLQKKRSAMEILLFTSVGFTWLPALGTISSLTGAYNNAHSFSGSQLYAKDNAACLFQAWSTQIGETGMIFNVMCISVMFYLQLYWRTSPDDAREYVFRIFLPLEFFACAVLSIIPGSAGWFASNFAEEFVIANYGETTGGAYDPYCWFDGKLEAHYRIELGFQYVWTGIAMIMNIISFTLCSIKICAALRARDQANASYDAETHANDDHSCVCTCCSSALCNQNVLLFVRLTSIQFVLFATFFPDLVAWATSASTGIKDNHSVATFVETLWRLEGFLFSVVYLSNTNVLKCFTEASLIMFCCYDDSSDAYKLGSTFTKSEINELTIGNGESKIDLDGKKRSSDSNLAIAFLFGKGKQSLDGNTKNSVTLDP